ncbi:MAG: hypothetical protein QM784_18235 [Polyangiaceae bacterium]
MKDEDGIPWCEVRKLELGNEFYSTLTCDGSRNCVEATRPLPAVIAAVERCSEGEFRRQQGDEKW